VLVEIYQREGRQQSLVIFLDVAIAHLGVMKHSLQDVERLLHPGASLGLGAVLALLFLVYSSLAFLHAPIGHVPCVGGGLVNRFGLPLITSIAPDWSVCPSTLFHF
jgi:hypothetical protein